MFQLDFLNYGALVHFAIIFVCLHFPGFLRSKTASDWADRAVTLHGAGCTETVCAAQSATVENGISLQFQNYALWQRVTGDI